MRRALTSLACAIAWVAGGGCEPADLVNCEPGTYLRDDDGREYCVYAPYEIERDALGRARCPHDLPTLVEFPEGFVCTRGGVAPDAIPEVLLRGLEGPEGPEVRLHDGPPCSIGREVTLASAPPGSIPELTSIAPDGYAVAWAGVVRVLDAAGGIVASHEIGNDAGLGYGLAEADGAVIAAWTDAGSVIVSRVGDAPSQHTMDVSAISGPSLAAQPGVGVAMAYVVGPTAVPRVVGHDLDPRTLEASLETTQSWNVAHPTRPAIVYGPFELGFAVAAAGTLGGVTIDGNPAGFLSDGALRSVALTYQSTVVWAASAVHVGRDGEHQVAGRLGEGAARVSIVEIPDGSFRELVSYGWRNRVAIQRISDVDQGPEGPPVVMARDGLRDAMLAASGTSMAVVWAEREAGGGEALVFAPVECPLE